MTGFIKCLNCVKQSIEVPLKADGDSMVCSLCESVY
jgi:hypothetical protein